MELRGIGIINVQDLFGLASVRERTTIDLVDRAGALAATAGPTTGSGSTRPLYHILDTPCPYIRMPVAIGRNISILVEIAARNHVLKLQGHHSAREFARKLEAQLERNRKDPIPAKATARRHHGPLRLGQERRRQVLRGPVATTRSTTSRCRCCACSSTTLWSWCAGTTASPWSPTSARPASPRSSRGLFAEIDRDRIEPTLLFLEASDEILVRRFSETRRPHPLAPDRPVIEGIRREREVLAELRARADMVFDTSEWSIHEIRSQVYREFATSPARSRGWSSRW